RSIMRATSSPSPAATWQAQRDTARAPGAQDWVCLASAGDSFTVRGTFNETAEYRRLDVVALNGGSFIALKDAPGPCPGSGWQLIASQGKRGAAGEKGERGAQGPQGNPLIAIILFSLQRSRCGSGARRTRSKQRR